MTHLTTTLESRLFGRYWDDGLLDLFAGIATLGIGVLWAVDLVAIGAAVPAMLAGLWVPLRRALVEPRAGHVEFSDARTGRNRRLLVGNAVLGLLTLALFAGLTVAVRSGPLALLSVIGPGIPAFLLALLAALTGWGLGLPRFLGYAAALCLAGAGAALADAEPELAILAGGLVIALSGGWRLGRFLRIPVDHAEGSE